MSGRKAAKASRSERADPGPWWRMPKTLVVAAVSVPEVTR
jgi:hypothetical protein